MRARFRVARPTIVGSEPDDPLISELAEMFAKPVDPLLESALALAYSSLPPDPGEDWRPWDDEQEGVETGAPETVEALRAALTASGEARAEPAVVSMIGRALDALHESHARTLLWRALAPSGQHAAIDEDHRRTLEVVTALIGRLDVGSEKHDALVASAMSALGELAQRSPRVDVHVPAPRVEVHPAVPEIRVDPQVLVQVPEQAAPIVNVAAPNVTPAPVVVNVPAPAVTVEPATVNVAAPVVNVQPEVTLRVPERRVSVERDRSGRIESAIVSEG